MHNLRHLLAALSQDASGRTARTTLDPSRSKPPFNEADIKRSLGFDPNDPNVHVRFIPIGEVDGKKLDEVTDQDLKEAMHDIYDRFAKANGGPVPVSAEDGRGLDGDVTGAVTDAAFRKGFDGTNDPFHRSPSPLDIPEQKPVEDLIKANARERESAGRDRWVGQRVFARDVLQELFVELEHAITKHEPMNSAHEGSSVIREEFEELWDHVKEDTGYTAGARKEALQVAATAIRYILDLDPRD